MSRRLAALALLALPATPLAYGPCCVDGVRYEPRDYLYVYGAEAEALRPTLAELQAAIDPWLLDTRRVGEAVNVRVAMELDAAGRPVRGQLWLNLLSVPAEEHLRDLHFPPPEAGFALVDLGWRHRDERPPPPPPQAAAPPPDAPLGLSSRSTTQLASSAHLERTSSGLDRELAAARTQCTVSDLDIPRVLQTGGCGEPLSRAMLPLYGELRACDAPPMTLEYAQGAFDWGGLPPGEPAGCVRKILENGVPVLGGHLTLHLFEGRLDPLP